MAIILAHPIYKSTKEIVPEKIAFYHPIVVCYTDINRLR